MERSIRKRGPPATKTRSFRFGSVRVEKEREIGPSGDRAIEPSKTGGSRKSIVAGQRPALRQKRRRPLGAPLDGIIHGQDSASREDESVMSTEEFWGIPELGMENLEILAFQIPEGANRPTLRAGLRAKG